TALGLPAPVAAPAAPAPAALARSIVRRFGRGAFADPGGCGVRGRGRHDLQRRCGFAGRGTASFADALADTARAAARPAIPARRALAARRTVAAWRLSRGLLTLRGMLGLRRTLAACRPLPAP